MVANAAVPSGADDSRDGGGRAVPGTTADDRPREFRFTDDDFAFIRRLVGEQTGISLSEGKREMVYGRLARRLRERNIGSFAEYCRLLEGDDGELMHLVNAITTNLTSFFRENHHFDYLRRTVIPDLLERNRQIRRLRIWSAGCSTGEEPYSLAITLKEALPVNHGWDVKILATDIDTNVLDKARRGVYAFDGARNLPSERLQRWFQRGKGANAGKVRVNPALQELISFRQLNLMSDPWPMSGRFDVIFCRNVVIYFDKPTQKRLFARFAQMLDAQRHIFIGHSETLFQICDEFELVGNTVYRKRT